MASPFATNLFGQARDDVGDWANRYDLAALRAEFDALQAEHDTYVLNHNGIWTPGPAFPTSPVHGDLFYETDTDKLWAWNSTAWVELARSGAWAAYTPSNTGITVGNGSQGARWTRSGRTITVQWQLQRGTTTSFTGSIRVGMPVAALGGLYVGSAWLYDDSAGRGYAASCLIGFADATSAYLVSADSPGDGFVDNNDPFAGASLDRYVLTITYEAAAST